MKNVNKMLILVCVLVLLIGVYKVSNYNCIDLYAKNAVVVELNRNSDLVKIQDSQGFVWEFFGCEDWEINDNCACIMNTQGTSEIFDDVILKVTYQG